MFLSIAHEFGNDPKSLISPQLYKQFIFRKEKVEVFVLTWVSMNKEIPFIILLNKYLKLTKSQFAMDQLYLGKDGNWKTKTTVNEE